MPSTFSFALAGSGPRFAPSVARGERLLRGASVSETKEETRDACAALEMVYQAEKGGPGEGTIPRADTLLDGDVLRTRCPYAIVVVSRLLPRGALVALNKAARARGIAIVLAITNGVTCSLFGDFGPRHEITDATGKPTQMLAMSNVEVLGLKPALLKVDGVEDGAALVIVTVAQSKHGLEDGDMVVLEDVRYGMEGINGRRFRV